MAAAIKVDTRLFYFLLRFEDTHNKKKSTLLLNHTSVSCFNAWLFV
jgi:hypothetical protein